MILFLRSLPFLIGALNAYLYIHQARHADSYPWVALMVPILFVVAGFFIGRRGGTGLSFWSRLIPGTLAVTSAGFGLLLAEGDAALWYLPLGAGVVSFLVLELLFLHTFLPSKYPTNGLSHLNLALVPVIFWLTSFTAAGLTVFIHIPRIMPVLLLTFLGGVLFATTSHADATKAELRRWIILGSWIGLHIGILTAVLPVRLAIHGTIAAVIGTLALRARRYGIRPAVPRMLFFAETMGGVLLFVMLVATSAWHT